MSVATAYGVGIESTLSFDALPFTERPETILSLHVRRVAAIDKPSGIPVRPCIAQSRTVHIVSCSSHVAVQIDSILYFELWLSSNRIECHVLDGISDDLVRYWILQQIIPLFLLLNGSTEFLHGMAVSARPQTESLSTDPSSCIAFLGASYAGKSTLLDRFLQQGHALVTDDHVALLRRNYRTVLPATPFYRPYRAAEDIGRRAAIYSPEPYALERLYLLEPVPAGTIPQIVPLTGMDAVSALFPNIHYSLHNPEKPDFFPLVEDRFRGLADLIREVPFARLRVPRSLDRLAEVYDLIQKDLTN